MMNYEELTEEGMRYKECKVLLEINYVSAEIELYENKIRALVDLRRKLSSTLYEDILGEYEEGWN